ncbi:hypothetical protein CYLTODRAFT_488385 [Cylindrobasidium torrendii FP15055 ss-10]|uniref:Uncharacterized protein n=1 Tax=Cylindrobasidium torrendii FP15055 ss-10 TaxID=1314674 RepID=A0A0D7BHS8_9AGAR|nr:hypothetical protein CYLTODRAFT_488385 [Cylindrobasidium torrendii FP15055 ss-10]
MTTMISRLKLKRAPPSTDALPAKKLRAPLETPHPTQASQDLAYRLPSSVGIRESPRSFSPVPLESSSRRLKENRSKPPKNTYGKYGKKAVKKSADLESPFGSSSSPDQLDGLFKKPALPLAKSRAQKQIALGGPLSRLPPAGLTSAPSSPKHEHSRRPSLDAHSNHFEFPSFSSSGNIDFNRPPSQASFIDYNAACFDADLPHLFQSTPKKSHDGGIDADSDDDDDPMLGPFTARSGYDSPDLDDDGDDVDWSDGLLNCKSKYHSADVKMRSPGPHSLESLLDTALVLKSHSPQRSKSLDASIGDKHSEDTKQSSSVLPVATRTRSGTVTGRSRSGTVRANAGPPPTTSSTASRGPPARTRSGTIIPGAAPDIRRDLKPTMIQPPSTHLALSSVSSSVATSHLRSPNDAKGTTSPAEKKSSWRKSGGLFNLGSRSSSTELDIPSIKETTRRSPRGPVEVIAAKQDRKTPPKAKTFQQAKRRALRRCREPEYDDGEIGDDELLLI